MPAQKIEKKLSDFIETLYRHADPRSPEYKRGLIDVLNFRIFGTEICCPFQAGTTHFDAYFAGNHHGHFLWRNRENYPSFVALIKELKPCTAISSKS
jgi:hypothetical protein